MSNKANQVPNVIALFFDELNILQFNHTHTYRKFPSIGNMIRKQISKAFSSIRFVLVQYLNF